MRGGTAAAAQWTAPAAPQADWILSRREVEAWLKRAAPGDRLLYAHGAQLVRGETSAMLYAAQSRDEVLLFQPRVGDAADSRFDYIAVKRLVARSAEMKGRTADPAMRVIFRRLKRAADMRERCPSDAMLASLAGLRVPQVKWIMRKLERDGAIASRVEIVASSRAYFRIVSILAPDGSPAAETASPGGLQ